MSRPSPTEQQEAAVEWLLRLDDADETERRAFAAWLVADPRNREAWEQVLHAWQQTGVHFAAPDAAEAPSTTHNSTATSQEIHRPGKRPRRRHTRLMTGAGMAVAAAVALAVALPAVFLRMEADYRTGTGETREVALPDGSTLHLAPQSAVATDFSGTQRRIDLLRGATYLEVRSDAGRPFTVDADDVEVTVTGTRFGVRLSDRAIAVGVRSGHVRVRDTRNATPGVALGRGERLTVRRTDRAQQRTGVPPEAVGLWTDGRLYLDGATVGAAIDRLRPYLPGWTVLAASGLETRRITGTYDLTAPESALRAVVGPHSGTIHHVSPWLRLVTGPEDTATTGGEK